MWPDGNPVGDGMTMDLLQGILVQLIKCEPGVFDIPFSKPLRSNEPVTRWLIVCTRALSSLIVGALTRWNRVLSFLCVYTPSRNNMWKCIFKFKAEPNRWISVTVPVCASLRVELALFIRSVDKARYTRPSTCPIIAGSRANKKRN